MAAADPMDRARIEEEAADWIARREGGPLDDATQQAFDRWLAQSPAHAAALRDFDDIWSGLGAVAREAAPAPAAANDTGWLGRRGFVALAAAAAAVAILAPTAILVGQRMTAAPGYATAVGEQKRVSLADGSKVTLNTATRVVARLSDDRRIVKLERGEALFEVAHDPRRPFIVESPYGSVRAVGTKFVVRVDPRRGLVVLVTEGKVLVARDARPPAPLSAGQGLTAPTDGAVAVAALDEDAMDKALAWRRGEVYFDGQSLADAVAQMQRYSPRALVVDPAVADLHVGGSFRTTDLDAFLDAIQTAFPVRVSREGEEVRIGPAAA